MKFTDEFPTFREEDMLQEVITAVKQGRLIDVSWGNDAMPAFEYAGLRLWVDFKDRKLREFPEGKRFSVSRADDDTNAPLVEFEEESKLEGALELIKLAGEDVSALEPSDLVRRMVTVVGLGFHFDTPVEEYGGGTGVPICSRLWMLRWKSLGRTRLTRWCSRFGKRRGWTIKERIVPGKCFRF